MANLVVLYGPSKIGKTTYLLHLTEYYQSLGLEVRGILSPAIFHNDKKVGIKVRDIYSGEEHNLAAKRPVQLPQLPDRLGFIFDDEVINWGKKVLKSSLPTEVFIVDEIGPLELKKDKGWKEAIGQIMLQQYKLGIVVLRESLHELVVDQWPVTEWVEYQEGLSINAFDHYFHR
jgi:nucleoside-triphosphatase THEP1